MDNQDHNSLETNHDSSSNPNEQSLQRQDLDPEIQKILPLILEAIEKTKRESANSEPPEFGGMIRSSFSGPLPPQVYRK